MKALFITKDKTLEERSLTLPPLKSDEVLIQVESFGINYADVMARQGLYGEAPPTPFVPGYEVVGIVTETGNAATQYKGKRAVGFTRFGGYATHAITKSSAIQVITNQMPNPDALALATQYVTAYYACQYAQTIRENETVLIQASAGGVGIALHQICQHLGATTIGLSGSQAKVDFSRRQGFDYVFNYSNTDYLQGIKDLYPQGLDVCFNSLAGKSFKRDQSLLNHTGRMVLYGGAARSGMKGGAWASLKMVWQMGLIVPIGYMMGAKTLVGINMLKVADFKPNIIQHCLQEVFKLYQAGIIKPVIGKTFNARDINQAHQFIESRESTGKLVCHW